MASPSSVQSVAPIELEHLANELLLFRPETRQRGLLYAKQRRVTLTQIDTRRIEAQVVGSELYRTEWNYDDSGWEPECTCRVAPYCKHAFATACEVLTLQQQPALDRILARVVPGAVSPKRSEMTVAGKPSASQFAGSVLLDKLRSTSDYWQRQQYFLDLTKAAQRDGLDAWHPAFDEILRHERDADILCWRLAQRIAATSAGVPPALQPFRDRPDLADRFARREGDEALGELIQWASKRKSASSRSLRIVLGLVQSSFGSAAVTMQVRATTARFSDEARSFQQLQHLHNEMRRSPEFFTAEAATLLDWVMESAGISGQALFSNDVDQARRLNGTSLRSLVENFGDSPLLSWQADLPAELAKRAGLVSGSPLRRDRSAASLVPTLKSHDGKLDVELAFVWVGGRKVLLRNALYLRENFEYGRTHPSFVISDGTIAGVGVEPPFALVERVEALGSLPVADEERDKLLQVLASQFANVREELGSHTHSYELQPVAVLDLRNDDWLQIRLFGRASDTWIPGQPCSPDNAVFELVPEGHWSRDFGGAQVVSGETTSNAAGDDAGAIASIGESAITTRPFGATRDLKDVWIEVPDALSVQPAIEWLNLTAATTGTKARAVGLRWPDSGVGFWLKLRRRGIEKLAAAWDQRPPGMAFFGTSKVRRMLSGEVRVTPRLKIKSSGVDWFSISAEWKAEGLELSDADLAALRNATTRFVKLSSGWISRDAADVYDEAALVLADLGIEAEVEEQTLGLWQLVGAKSESLAALERLGADPETMATLKRLRTAIEGFDGLQRVATPHGLVGELRPYQERGLDFLAHSAGLGHGAVLADDMGLGKTVQALAWFLHQKALHPEGGPALVVCPASVVHNWQREAQRFAPGLRVLLMTGSKDDRDELRRSIPDYDLIVTNYALLRRDTEAWQEVDFGAVVFDEAQNIKNPDAAVSKAAHKLRAQHRLALTGTPLENRALDLWSIVDAISPGYLGPRSRFQARFDRVDAPPHLRTLLAARLRPLLLRRTKREVASDLPERIEERIDCEMPKDQRQLYVAEVRRSRALIDDLVSSTGGVAANKIHILAALTRLRQICCHPQLAGARPGIESGKFAAFFELLEPLIAEGHKVLVFSQFVECLHLLKQELTTRDIPFHILTGQTTKRAAVVDAFQDDPRACVFLVSLKAGGTGLNLTAASYVVIFDPWWNPAVEAQAIDRTHRIGQDRTVIAYRLITRGTIEERIFELQQRKAQLVRDVLGEDGFARSLTRDDLDFLLQEV